MKEIIKMALPNIIKFSALMSLLFTGTPALAHSGHHHHSTVFDSLFHVITQYDHIALIVLFFALLTTIVAYRIRKKKVSP